MTASIFYFLIFSGLAFLFQVNHLLSSFLLNITLFCRLQLIFVYQNYPDLKVSDPL